jgi:hypothetical protein
MNIITTADFKEGEYKIPDASSSLSTAVNKLQGFIDRYKDRCLNQLYGKALADTIRAYYAADKTPADALLNKIINPFTFDDGGIKESGGVKEILQGYIFYEYARNEAIDYSLMGANVPKSETADRVSPSDQLRMAESKFNCIIESVEAIQGYCENNSTDYPTFDGRRFIPKYSF